MNTLDYQIIENGNYLVHFIDEEGLPVFIEMTPEEFESNYGIQ